MKRRKIICMAYSVCFPFMAYCMDDPIPTTNPTSSQTIIQISNEPTAADQTRNRKKPSPVPNIILTSKGSPGSSSRNLVKTVASTKELKDHIKKTQNTQRTARNTPPVRRAARKFHTDDDTRAPTAISVDDLAIGRQKRSMLPTSLIHLTGKSVDDQHKKMYTEKEVWGLIESCNPVLHAFGEKHNLELEDLELFAACMAELEINPQLITEHIHASNNQPIQKGVLQQAIDRVLGDPHEQHLDNLHKQYAKMQREKPENYKALLLELMKTVADQAEGEQANRSTIADTHTSLQSQAVVDKEQERRLAYFVAAVSFITAVGGWVFGIIGQFINPINSTH